MIPRVDFLDENGDTVDIANELIVHTALKWESDTSENIESLHKDVRQGRVRIPSKCLREMIQEHHAFATRICKPPVAIELKVDGIDAVRSGHPIELFMEVHFKGELPWCILFFPEPSISDSFLIIIFLFILLM